jgi:D-arabinose 1-dehydrogenase-like Zn-dependent alcohol dehydrogenase
MPTIRAIVLERLQTPLAMRVRPVPQPAASEVLIEVAACGVCPTVLIP